MATRWKFLTSEAQVPPPAWESLVVTGKARSSIRRATREAVRKQFAGLGRRIIERAFERMGKPQSEEKLSSVVPRLARPSLEDVYAAVGRGELHSGDVVKAVFPISRIRRRRLRAPTGRLVWCAGRRRGEVQGARAGGRRWRVAHSRPFR